jgi:hypothetical protein
MRPTTAPRPVSTPLPAPSLGRYTDTDGRPREVLALPGRGGSTLVVDRDALSWGDRRLVAHLAPDEPPDNAWLVCRDYLCRPTAVRCRALAPEDLRAVPFDDGCQPSDAIDPACHGPQLPPAALGHHPPMPPTAVELRDRRGRRHRLERLATGRSLPQLRWCPCEDAAPGRAESVRDVVACMESYEPVRTLTAAALVRHREDPAVSVAALRGELERLDASRIVLNRGLRQAVVRAMRTQNLTLSEIAYRCGRVKRDEGGRGSGETSWLARRVGIAPEGGAHGEPTPWIHTEVLALIAREGLGISPHEVEL